MEHIESWLTQEEGDFLSAVAKNKICLEIGSYKGKSSSYIATQARKLICLDPFCIRINKQWTYDEKALVYLEFLSNTKRYQNVTSTRGLSVDCAEFFISEYLDMVFIDGSHTYENVVAVIQSWLPKIKYNGVMLLHDYTTYPDVKKAFNQVLGMPEKIIDSIAQITNK